GAKIRLVSVRMPENATDEGRVTSPETMASFLREVRTGQHVREKSCNLVLSSSQAFFRHVTLPAMSESELVLNLPYEFRDFIAGDTGEYTFDYCVDEIVLDDAGKAVGLELFAAACSKKLASTYESVLRKAGFRLTGIIPAPLAYMRLLKNYIERSNTDAETDVVFVDIGQTNVVVSLFRGAHYEASKTIEFGCDAIDEAIAELYGIDPYTASSYKYNNFDNALDTPQVQTVYDRFAIEVSRVVNFYNFNTPEQNIEQMYFLGGGAQIPQLTEHIAEAISVPSDSIEVLLPPEAQGQDVGPIASLAIAAMLEGEAM
ncbi:MAG: pilus assembly protein PilM, partial [Eggerthellaceae bacterium]|nr:pilus assembly protein PilM [Eggerthellaceae bacterium]